MNDPNLSDLQLWMNQKVLKPAKLREEDEENLEGKIDDIICGGNGISSKERLEIYVHGYKARLLECIRADFPCLNTLLGDDLFNYFAFSYIKENPSNSYSLFDLGKEFPQFLDNSRPKKSDLESLLPVELAKLERVRVEVQRSVGTEGKEPNLSFENSFYCLVNDPKKYTVSPCLRLMPANFNLVDLINKIENKGNFVIPNLEESKIVVCRKDYKLNFHCVEEWQYYFLKSFENGFQTIGEATRFVENYTGKSESEILAELILWMPLVYDMGYLVYES